MTTATTEAPPAVPPTYALTAFLQSGAFDRIVDFAVIPGTSNTEAIAVAQKAERILRVSLTGAFAPTVYGDLSDRVGGGGEEEGLLSATFSPDFPNDGRIYVSAGDAGIQVFAADGKYVGVIPLPRSASSVAFSGPNKKVLYGKGAGMKNPDGTEYRVQGRNNAKAIYRVDTIAQGFTKRAK